MNKKNIFLIIATIFFIGLIIFFTKGDRQESIVVVVDVDVDEEVVLEEAQNITPQQVEDRVQNNGAFVVDVRRLDEWDEGHVAGATLFPVENIDAGQFPDLAFDSEIYVYCRSGNRAGRAEETLESAGFTNVINIGGFDDWVNAGGSVVQKESDPDTEDGKEDQVFEGSEDTVFTQQDLINELERLVGINTYPNNKNIDPSDYPVVLGTYSENDLVLIERYFCSDVCPDAGSVSILYQDVASVEACEDAGGEPWIDPAWGAYQGCAPIVN